MKYLTTYLGAMIKRYTIMLPSIGIIPSTGSALVLLNQSQQDNF
jgi:hypothetical protein